ncbi:MAG: PilZ domain-containing protein [Candidatus Methylomirabilales bacterium]
MEGEPAEHSKEGTRRHPRWIVRGRLTGRIRATDTATLIDLSPGGAQIEHTSIVRPGTIATLTLPVKGRDLTLRCQVVWSRVHRPQVRGDRGRELIYRSGLQFLDLPEASRRLLEKYLASLKKEGPAPEPA